MANNTKWRRFQIIDKSKEDALVKLLDEKGISRSDLTLILRTIRLNPKAEDQQTDEHGTMSFEQLLKDNEVDTLSLFDDAPDESEGE